MIKTLDELKEICQQAKESKIGLCIEVTIPNQDDTEYIINKSASIDNKLAYYEKTYGYNLTHRMNDRIKIVNAFAIDFEQN